MSYFSSGNVKVFPSSYRTQYASGKFTSEENLTSIVKALAGKDSFVVGFTPTGGSTAKGVLKVVIDGYYFEITDFEVSGTKTLYIRKDAGYLVNFGDATRNLDATAGFTGISDTAGTSGEYYSLQVCKDSRIINLGYIDALCDSDGNWIDISNLIITNDGKIDPSSIDFNSIQNYIYVAKFIAEGATQLGEWSSGTFSPYNKGGYNGGVTTTIKFANGVPTESIKITYSTNQPSGTANNGDIWFIYQ